MKIIDETGAELTEAPDLSLGRLIDDVEIVKQVSHFVPIEYLANGSTIVEEVIDVPGVDPQPAWEETVPLQRYIKYTEDELAEQRAKEEHEAQMAQMPERMGALESANNDIILMMADLIGG